MSPYEDVLRSLNDIKTIHSHLTALGKVRNATEDQVLIGNLNRVIAQLQSMHMQSKAKSTPGAVTEKYPGVRALVDYCREMIGTHRPEWQILAERHNWSPPRKTPA